ncbi:MAG TPA: carboxypeptidase regulatory-like domain-containing protein [Bryobacteraceae bacterium]|nr:carboxypeptidase regulatory-like domain-containing protein [Bryobacteraceae bacterium]
MKGSILRAVSAVLMASALSWASVGGRIEGTVTDASGAVIQRATVAATNIGTGVTKTTMTGDSGGYAFPLLPVGRYRIEVSFPHFASYTRNDVVVDANSSLVIDAALQSGQRSETITVNDSAVHVETVSTQEGEVISGRQMTAVPLNGRSFTDLLSLQPGVAPATSINANTVQDVGASVFSPSGDLNPGTISINGQREFANAFIVNGSDVEEDVNMGTSIIPNLDSIAEFRILTNNFDAEYGEFSGGQINVVTKSGTNEVHGDAFEFLRNTDLDARNYFSPTRGTFHQNQYGGTVGGPIRRDKIFFFLDYQGTSQSQGIDTGSIAVPSVQDRAGNLSDIASSITGTVSGPYFANLLSQKLGNAVTPGENYYTAGCNSTSQCVFPNAVIPQRAWSAPAQKLLPYIPLPNLSSNTFSTSSYNQMLDDSKGGARLDANTRVGMLSGYYFLDNYTLDNPYPVAQGGASVPGFNAAYLGQAQLINLSDTKSFGPNAVNELSLSFMRNNNILGKPEGGVGVSLASQGFLTDSGTPSIVALAPKLEGVENAVFNSFSLGTNTNELKQVNNTYQVADGFSRVIGKHTLKFGGEFHYDQVNANPIAQFNGNFVFTGSETGDDFADFLLGAPSQYNQSQLNFFYSRNKYAGAYAQDSWRVTPNFTLNYGLRWDRIEPWYEKYNQISTFEAGQQSQVFPGAPAGILYPTDPGVYRGIAPPGEEFSPRIGIAYSPNADADSFLGKLTGGPGKTSVRAGFGMFYTAIEALTVSVAAGNAPYGTTYTSPGPPLFNDPFITASTGQNFGQPFPVGLAPLNVTRSNPDSNIDWSDYVPISGIPAYVSSNKIPYSEQYMFSIQRQIGQNTLLSASYVGNEGHHLLVLVENNPGNPALCLSLSQPNAVAPGTVTCGPFGEDTTYTTAAGQTVNGTRGPLGSNFGSNANQAAIGNSNYNALELSVRHKSGRLQMFASYTYGKSLDYSSNLGEAVNPNNMALSDALSSFDIKHNFVVSYDYELPIDRLFHAANHWTKDWRISGITHLSTGFPVTIVNTGDNSLLGTNPNGVNNASIDEPELAPGPLNLNQNPRNGNSYFNTSLFSLQPLGTPGNSPRRFFYGPGSENFDVALSKNISLTESTALLFRVEAFNVFNHAQFFGPLSVDGTLGSSSFGDVVSAAAPRILQAAVKFTF